jgi:D-amino peptidase
VRGAKKAGAKEIVVVDCHGAGGGYTFNSLVPELLDSDCEWVAHHAWSRYTEMLEKGCDACLLVGMHAKANTPEAVMSHTISTTGWRTLKFNDTEVGEVGINAALCGHFGTPVLLVTGDTQTCAESKAVLGEGLTTVAVKQGLSMYSAKQIPPVRARRMIEEGANLALQDLSAVKPYIPSKPTTITVGLGSVDAGSWFRGRNIEMPDPMTVVSKGADWMAAWNNIWGWAVRD